MIRRWGAIVAMIISGCGATDPAMQPAPPSIDGGTTEPSADGGATTMPPPALRGACETASRLGGFQVEALERYSAVQGAVLDGVVPSTVRREAGREGGCVLLEARHLNCPPCSAGETCGDQGRCVRYPTQEDVGTVTITGLVGPVEMEARSPGFRYFDTSLPNPPFEGGATIHLTSTESRLGKLDLYGVGVEPLETEGELLLRIERGMPLAVAWRAPSQGAASRILLELNIDQHGASPIDLRCNLDDTGSAEIPSSLIDALLDSGISGYPNGKMVRATLDSQSVQGGCVDLAINFVRKATVRVPGHLPCSASDPCPAGLSCDLPTNTCQ